MSLPSESFDPRSPRTLSAFQEHVHELATQALAIDLEGCARDSSRTALTELELRLRWLLTRTCDLLEGLLSRCEETLPAFTRPEREQKPGLSLPLRDLQLVAFVAQQEVQWRLELERVAPRATAKLADCASSLHLLLSTLRAVDASLARATVVERLLPRASAEPDRDVTASP